MEDTLFFINTIHRLSGVEVTEQVVDTMVKVYGAEHIKTKMALAALKVFQTPINYSPSELVASTLDNATVYIPSASAPRRKGRSVD